MHLSTAEEAELLRQDKPAWVTAEVTPQHLLLNTAAYGEIGTLVQMNPPIRSPHDNEVLGRHSKTAFSTLLPPTTPPTRSKKRRRATPTRPQECPESKLLCR
ncbi:hypothetical protein NDI45_21625 [Leptolyngbya sp. GB1-A1]